jgi:VWFA-related protein
MRVSAIALLAVCSAWGQFRSTVPLVVAPTTVTDSKGRYVDGLDEQNLILYDNNVPQTIHMDWMTFPISLVVAVQTSSNAGPVLEKLGGSGILFTQLLAGDAGETALLSFGDQVEVRQNFTGDPDTLIKAIRKLRMDGDRAPALDALSKALDMLSHREPGRRHVILMISEKRDRGSESQLQWVMREAQKQNAAVYWLTFSPFMQPFTTKAKLKMDPGSERWRNPEEKKREEEKPKKIKDVVEAKRDLEKYGKLEPADLGPGGFIYAIGELIHMKDPDIADMFTRTTGGTTDSFLKKDTLEKAVVAIGKEIHRQYILTFEPKNVEQGNFHSLRVEVRNRPELQVKTRTGYWAVQ